MNKNKTVSKLNEDAQILIKKEIEKCLVNYVSGVKTDHKTTVDISEIPPELKSSLAETQQLFLHPPRGPKMLPSTSATIPPPGRPKPKMERKSLMECKPPRLVDEPVQATVEKYQKLPRNTLLSRTRQQLCKRNSGAQSTHIQYKNVKVQTETCAKNISITVNPLEFLGMYEKGTNYPTGIGNIIGTTRNQATQMYDHITPNELFCIEWIHKHLFEVKLSPNTTLVVDDRIRNISESANVT